MTKKPETAEQREIRWTKACGDFLVGKTVKRVFFMPRDEAEESMGFSSRPLVIEFSDGHSIFAQSDDEGNDGGAYGTTSEKLPVIPVF
jgi:hypothetical protein